MTSDLTPSTPGDPKVITNGNSDNNESPSPGVRQRETDGEDKKSTSEKTSNSCSSSTHGPTHPSPLTQAEVEGTMRRYEDTFEDYLEMFIQFGYVTLFSSAFPLAAMCALMNNVVEVRSDAFKLTMHHQRPFGQQVENIGTWQVCGSIC